MANNSDLSRLPGGVIGWKNYDFKDLKDSGLACSFRKELMHGFALAPKGTNSIIIQLDSGQIMKKDFSDSSALNDVLMVLVYYLWYQFRR